jgi:simple sugar transport system ATP-binding protein
MDEPTAVLTPQEADALFVTLRAMAEEGKTVIFISHKLHEVKAIADRVTVLRGGRTIATVDAADATPRSLSALMVGREIEITRREGREAARPEVVLALDGVRVAGDRGGEALKGITLAVRSGEIVGVAGVAGNGQRELAETIAGIRPPSAGSIRVGDRALASGDARAAIRAGVAYVPEDRLGTGLAPSLSVAHNVSLKRYREPPISRGPLLVLRRMTELARALIQKYGVQAPGPGVPVRNLSGGNLQKLVLGREFHGNPRVLIAAQPTRGLDVGAIETVHAYLDGAAGAGLAVLLVSEDLDEILALADRIVVMYDGEIAGELEAKGASVEEIGYLMGGGTDDG